MLKALAPPRLITNGHALAEGPLLGALADAGLRHVHISLYSDAPAIHDARLDVLVGGEKLS